MSSRKLPISKCSKIKVGLTMGDPSGIGPEVILGALSALRVPNIEPVVIGDRWVFEKLKNKKSAISKSQFVDLANVARKNFVFGAMRPEYGKASVECLDAALKLIQRNQIDCLVTAPISKEAVQASGLHSFTGHTEYLAGKTSTKDYVMMLLNAALRFSLVSRHIPLKRVSGFISPENIHETALVTQRYLRKFFAISAPRLVACGINPHASDNGIIGDEENRVIARAIKSLRKESIRIDGPLPADIAILRAFQKKYDCVIAMYHDQALIPLKLTGEFSGVNMTLGLPFVRTSVLHGVAFDIAGKGIANSSSMLEAIKLAAICASNLKNT